MTRRVIQEDKRIFQLQNLNTTMWIIIFEI